MVSLPPHLTEETQTTLMEPALPQRVPDRPEQEGLEEVREGEGCPGRGLPSLGLKAADPRLSVWAPMAAFSTPHAWCLALPCQRFPRDSVATPPEGFLCFCLKIPHPCSWHSPQSPNGPHMWAERGQMSKANAASSHPTAGTSLPSSSSTGFSFGKAQPKLGVWGVKGAIDGSHQRAQGTVWKGGMVLGGAGQHSPFF